MRGVCASGRTTAALLLLALGAAVAGCQCAEPPRARARQIASLDEAVGGKGASARVGDFLLENDEIRVVIEQAGGSLLGLDVGGTLIDADLARPEARFRGGNGLDLLRQIGPVSNLLLPNPKAPTSVRITTPREGRSAQVTVEAKAVPIQKVIGGLDLLLKTDFLGSTLLDEKSLTQLYTEYELRPGERLVRITTTVGFDVAPCKAEPSDPCQCDDFVFDRDCDCPVPQRCGLVRVIDADALPDRPEPMGLSDLLLGDLPRPMQRCKAGLVDCPPGQTCTPVTSNVGGESAVCRSPASKDPGLFLGDMLLFGGYLSLFVPGIGYDTETDIRRLFDMGGDTLSTPLKFDAVFGVGEAVSYGYAPPRGQILAPIFGGPFALGATAAAACRHDQPRCLARTLIRAERWLSVGSGDVASAREPLLQARGVAYGTLSGTVLAAHSGEPVSGAEVFALADPRALACDADCQVRCGSLDSTSDERLEGWSLDQLIAQNRCRTPGGAHLSGLPKVEASAVTDVGTDPVRDGRFRLPLLPGRYVVFAQDGELSMSRLVPVSIAAGRDARAAFVLPEPGVLSFTLVDEGGRPSPGRVVAGRCLPRDPCQSDADCPDGTLCQAGACACRRTPLRPLELKGTRYADGVLAMQQTADGVGTLRLPPGDYELVFSHGPHSGIDRQQVTLRPGLTTSARGVVPRRIAPGGFSSSDFHVHGGNSIDSGTSAEDRVASFLAEDVDFLSSGDHDFLTDYEPTVRAMGARGRLGSQVGVEVSTLELGHFIGYPLQYSEWDTGSMRKLVANGAPEWTELTPAEIFTALRGLHKPGVPGVVQVAHVYSYFDSYGLHPTTLEPTDSIISQLINELAQPRNFSGDFEAAEVLNGKSFDLVHRPTIGEVRFHSEGLDALVGRLRRGEIDEAEFARASYELSTEATRRMLHRTQEEQLEALRGPPLGRNQSGAQVELDCRCGSDGDCAAGRRCDPATANCVDDGADPAHPLPANAMCRMLRGAVDDWFIMLNRGLRRTMVGGSDVHGVYGYEAGLPRTMLMTGSTTAPYLGDAEVAQAVLDGRAVVTNGPMLRFELVTPAARIGDVVAGKPNEPVRLRVQVETAGWYDVDRIEVYRNGELIHWVRGCEARRVDPSADPDAHPCIRRGEGLVWDGLLEDRPERDSWYAVMATGLDGRTLAPVYSSATLPRFGTFELTQRIYDLIPNLASLRVPRFPSLYPTFPLAVTNPIWVDVGGDGWTPPWEAPSWCRRDRDFGCTR